MQNIVYRQLAKSNVKEMKSLSHFFGDIFEEKSTYCDKTPSEKYLVNLLDDKNFVALIAENTEGIVGGLVAYFLQKFEQERSEIYIYDLAVHQSYRRQGIATKLIETLKEIGSQRDAWTIFVQADVIDVPAVKLYESLCSEKEAPFHFDIYVS